MKSVTVKIDGIDYQLKGNDEMLLKRSAEIFDQQIQSIKSNYKGELPQLTVSVLAALNIVESIEQERKDFESERKFLLDEIEKMGQFVNELLSENAEKR